jgi:chromosomal replication initiation ATPase DnaA
MREMLDAGFSTTQVGRFFQRDHTTVIAGARASRMRAAD